MDRNRAQKINKRLPLNSRLLDVMDDEEIPCITGASPLCSGLLFSTALLRWGRVADDLAQGTLDSILKQEGLKERVTLERGRWL